MVYKKIWRLYNSFKWKIYIEEPGEKHFDVSYSLQNEKSQSRVTINAAGKTLENDILPTGKTVGEPNQNWHIDNFKSYRVGKINFPEAGFNTIELVVKPADNEKVNFQWLWVR